MNQHLHQVVSAPWIHHLSVFQGFWWEIWQISYWGSLTCDQFLLSCFFQEQFDYIMSRCGCCVSVTWSSSLFKDIYLYVFHQCGEVWVTLSLNNLSAPFSLFSSGTPTLYVGPLGSHRSLSWCSLSFNIFFSSCSLESIISIVLYSSSLILSSVYSNMLLNPSGEFFSISIIALFSSRISFWVLSMSSIFWYFFHIREQ